MEVDEFLYSSLLGVVGLVPDCPLVLLQVVPHCLVGKVVEGVGVAECLVHLAPLVEAVAIVEVLLAGAVEQVGVALGGVLAPLGQAVD